MHVRRSPISAQWRFVYVDYIGELAFFTGSQLEENFILFLRLMLCDHAYHCDIVFFVTVAYFCSFFLCNEGAVKLRNNYFFTLLFLYM